MPASKSLERSSAERKHFLVNSQAVSRVLRTFWANIQHSCQKNEDLIFISRRAPAAGQRPRWQPQKLSPRYIMLPTRSTTRNSPSSRRSSACPFEARAASTRGFDWAASLY